MGTRNNAAARGPALSGEDAASHSAAYRISARPVDEWRDAIAQVENAERVREILVNVHANMRLWREINDCILSGECVNVVYENGGRGE